MKKKECAKNLTFDTPSLGVRSFGGLLGVRSFFAFPVSYFPNTTVGLKVLASSKSMRA